MMLPYQQGSTGPDITRLEIRLKELGLYGGGLDTSFGAGMNTAVRAFQQNNRLPVTGIVDQPTWTAIFAGPSPGSASLKDKPPGYRCLALTGAFETSTSAPGCFCGLAGNFDGQGISFGTLQFNLGQGTLQPILRTLDQKNPGVLREVFADQYPALQQMLLKRPVEQVAWGATISDPTNPRRVSEPWRSHFKALGERAECQEIQLSCAAHYLNEARAMFKEYQLFSERGLALAFDIAVQNGSISAKTKVNIMADYQNLPAGLTREELEVERMKIIARRRADDSNFPKDVFARKNTIATGVGIVHALGFDLERQYNLRLVPAAV